jgi:hypothetical protein
MLEGDLEGKVAAPFPEEKAAMLIDEGPPPMSHTAGSNSPPGLSTP